MTVEIKASSTGFSATIENPDALSRTVEAETLDLLVALLSAAGCHSTDITDAVDAAGLGWPSGE